MQIRLTVQEIYALCQRIDNNDGRLSADSSAQLDYAWDTLEDFVKTFDKLVAVAEIMGKEYYDTPVGKRAQSIVDALNKR